MKYTKNELIATLQHFHKEEGKVPAYHDNKIRPDILKGGATYANYFGSFNNALKEAGFATFYNEQGKKTTGRKTYKSVRCSRTKKTRMCLNCENTISNMSKRFCCTECKTSHNFKKTYTIFLQGKLRGKSVLRKCMKHHTSYECVSCPPHTEPVWNGKPLILELDHIDGNPSNNLPTNLRFLCPNCHSQTPTYRKSNKLRN